MNHVRLGVERLVACKDTLIGQTVGKYQTVTDQTHIVTEPGRKFKVVISGLEDIGRPGQIDIGIDSAGGGGLYVAGVYLESELIFQNVTSV